MSVVELCKGDKVVKQVATHVPGSSGGNSITFADSGAAIDCLLQTPSASESKQYEARGQRFGFSVFFSSDPSLTVDDRLKLTQRASSTLTTPLTLRVLDVYVEGRPGENMLWIADCEIVSTRSTQ